VHVFRCSSAGWTLESTLLASDSARLSGGRWRFRDTTVAGRGWPSSGAAYVFTRSGGQWTEQAKPDLAHVSGSRVTAVG
jgi:hypothetical protein